ncbi:MAG: J domain-containing protein [Elusimicrobia bacterium]|nr:J domain-containing protein [Elusimicrobiota bacterium]
MTPEQAYSVLGLPPGGATPPDILKAYRKKALATHPDRARSPEESDEYTRRFLEVRDAYECLKKAGFPVPEPQEVVPDPPQVRTYKRRFAPKGDDLPVPLREKLGFGPGPSVDQLLFWGLMLPAAVVLMFLSVRWLLGVLRAASGAP